MLEQEIYDITRDHLLKQKRRSLRSFTGHGIELSGCAYNGYNGLHCAIGIHILPYEYTPNLEGKGVNHEDLEFLVERLGVSVAFLQNLQVIHDEYDPHEWKEKLDEFAARYGLRKGT